MGQRPLVEKGEPSLLKGMDFSISSSAEDRQQLYLLEQEVGWSLHLLEESHSDTWQLGMNPVTPFKIEDEVGSMQDDIVQSDGAENHDTTGEEAVDEEENDDDSANDDDYADDDDGDNVEVTSNEEEVGQVDIDLDMDVSSNNEEEYLDDDDYY